MGEEGEGKGEQKQQQRGNTSVAPPTPWSSIMAWRTLMAMVMAALLATSSCLAQDALPDLPDVPEMPAIGTTVNSRLDRRRLRGREVPGPGQRVQLRVARRAVSERQRKHQGGDPAVVRGQEPGGGRHELLLEPVARLCGRGRQEERDRVSVPGRTVRNHV